MKRWSHDVHVSKHGNSSWKVTQDRQIISTHRTQFAAIDRGRAEAQRDGVDLAVHGRNGQVRSKDSYGNLRKRPAPAA